MSLEFTLHSNSRGRPGNRAKGGHSSCSLSRHGYCNCTQTIHNKAAAESLRKGETCEAKEYHELGVQPQRLRASSAVTRSPFFPPHDSLLCPPALLSIFEGRTGIGTAIMVQKSDPSGFRTTSVIRHPAESAISIISRKVLSLLLNASCICSTLSVIV